MTLREAIESLFPKAVFGVDFVVGQEPPGGDEVVMWDEATLGPRDDAAIAAEQAKPAPTPARLATTYQLMSALTDAQREAYPTAVKPWDQRLFSARDTPWPETNAKIARIAAALGTTPAAWFDAALNPPAS